MPRSSKSLCLMLLLALLALGITRAEPSQAQGDPPVLAFYYAWFDMNTWSSGQVVDQPAIPYISADRATIERHVAEAQSAGIEVFVQSWYGPQVENNQTETNFQILLDVAAQRGFKAAVDFESFSPFYADDGAMINGLATLLNTHVNHPAYFRYQGKPVIFFWRQQRFTPAYWQTLRAQLDPNNNTIWIAEGVDISYQSAFDGHHLYSIAWAASPRAEYAKWSGRVQNFEAQNGVNRLWVATVMPGYNDTLLPRADAFAVDRRGGAYFRESCQGAIASQPDMVIINSFNEWPEGTHIEPSASYGNTYLDIARELVTNLRNNPPAAPPPAEVAESSSTSAASAEPVQPDPVVPAAQDLPDEPYILVGGATNIRAEADITSTAIDLAPANAAISVIGQSEDGEWWAIENANGTDNTGWIAASVVNFVGDADSVAVVVSTDPPTESAEVEPAEDDDELAEGESAPSTEFVEVEPAEVETTEPITGTLDAASSETEELAADVDSASAETAAEDEQTPAEEADSEAVEDETTVAEDEIVADEPNANAVVGELLITGPVNVREQPALTATRLSGLFPDDSVGLVSVSADGDWWQVLYDEATNGVGWIAAEFADLQGEPGVPIFGQPTPAPTVAPATPQATSTVAATATPQATPTLIPTLEVDSWPTFAPIATSAYQGTSVAMLADYVAPTATPFAAERTTTQGSEFPWGIPLGLSGVVLGVVIWWARRRVETNAA